MENFIKRDDIKDILITSKNSQIIKLIHTEFKLKDNLVDVQSIYQFIDKRVDNKYLTYETAIKKIDISTIDIKILKTMKNPENPFFGAVINGKKKYWIRKNILDKIKKNPDKYRFVAAKTIANQIGLKSIKKIKTSYKRGSLKGGVFLGKTLYFPRQLKIDIDNGYIPPIHKYTIFPLRDLAKETNVKFDLVRKKLDKGFFNYTFQYNTVEDNSIKYGTWYVYREEYMSRLKEFNRKYNKKTWKNIKLINNIFKNRIKKRFILRIGEDYYIRYIIKGTISIDKVEYISGEIITPIKKNPFPDEENIFLSEMSLTELKIIRRYDFTNIDYLRLKMIMIKGNPSRTKIIEANTKEEIIQLEILLRNHEIYLGSRNSSYKIIATFEDKKRTMSLIHGLNKTNARMKLKRRHLLPAVLIHSNMKFRNTKSIEIFYSKNNGYLKACIDDIIYLTSIDDIKSYGTPEKDMIESAIDFLKSKKKGRKLSINDNFHKKIKGAKIITDGDIPIKFYRYNIKPILISFDRNIKNIEILYQFFNKDRLTKYNNIIPFYIYEAILKTKSMFSSLYEYSRILSNNKFDINFYIDWGEHSIIEARGIYKIYSLKTLTRKSEKEALSNYVLKSQAKK